MSEPTPAHSDPDPSSIASPNAAPPLAATLARLAPHGAGAHVPPHPSGPWRAADELATDEQALAGLMATVGAAWRCERADVQAMRLVELWTWTVAFPGAAAIIADGRLPDLRAANVLLAFGEGAPWPPIALRRTRFRALAEDPASGHPDVHCTMRDRDELAAALHAELTEAHLAPLVSAAAALGRRSSRALWRGVGDRLAQAFVHAGDALGQPADGERLAARALAPGAPLPSSGSIDVRTFARADGSPERVLLRNGCCLYHRAPDSELCLGCPLIDDAARARRIAARGA